MENDKQINDLYLEKVKNIFLSEDLLAKSIKQEVYSLSDEFGKSGKNKNILVQALILLYVAVIGFGAYFLTTIEENKIKRIDVNIAEFRQFNLMELLAEKKENEEKLVQLQQELEDFRNKSMEQIKKMSPREQQKAMAALNEKMRALEDNYNQQIKDKEKALETLERSITSEKQKIASATKENETVIKNYQNLNQMQQMENERLKKEYEVKIAKLKAEHKSELEQFKAEHKAEIELFKKDNQKLISAAADYENLLGDLTKSIKEKNQYIGSYEYALKYMAMTGRETGYVIDARDSNWLIIFVDHIYSVKKGDIAYIFKSDSTPIAKIELNPEKGKLIAKVKEVLKPVKIEPFDKILLKLEAIK